jgi:hypothetical protein
MLRTIPKELRTFILQQFTIELLKNSEFRRKKELDTQIEEKLKTPSGSASLKKELEKPITGIPKIPRRIKKPIPKSGHEIRRKKKIHKKRKIFRIPEPRLPGRLQYLRPTPTQADIDLEKLNPLIKDPAVKTIECNGPGEKVIVKGTMGIKPTGIILNKDEITQIIERFSEKTKIPVGEGIYKVVFGKLILSAITSKIIGSKFIINKMSYVQSHPGMIGFQR